MTRYISGAGKYPPLALLFLMISCALTGVAQQGVTTRYIYDANGRLRAVITPDGAAIYDYDPAGNFTAIRRLNNNACEALEFTPKQGPFGAQATLYGVGFNGQVSRVTFNGINAQIVSQTPISVTVRVPSGATSGAIAVSLPCGLKTFATPFTISGVQVMPSLITVSPSRTVQFSADVVGVIDPGVTWSVSGVAGGNDSLGIITQDGLYAAPVLPANAASMTFLIRAASVVNASLFGEAQVKVTANGYEFQAQGVAVQYGTPVKNAVAYAAGPVSVRYGDPPGNGPVYVSVPVSARFDPPPARIFAPAINSVSVARSASVSAILGGPLSKGKIATLTIKGANLAGITAVQFIREDGAEDVSIAASDLTITADGTTLTIRVNVNRQAELGRHTMRLMTPDGVLPLTVINSTVIDIIP